MGVKQSKRSVDISSTPQKGVVDGDVVKPEDVKDLKEVTNGDATKESPAANGDAKPAETTNGEANKGEGGEEEAKEGEEEADKTTGTNDLQTPIHSDFIPTLTLFSLSPFRRGQQVQDLPQGLHQEEALLPQLQPPEEEDEEGGRRRLQGRGRRGRRRGEEGGRGGEEGGNLRGQEGGILRGQEGGGNLRGEGGGDVRGQEGGRGVESRGGGDDDGGQGRRMRRQKKMRRAFLDQNRRKPKTIIESCSVV